MCVCLCVVVRCIYKGSFVSFSMDKWQAIFNEIGWLEYLLMLTNSPEFMERTKRLEIEILKLKGGNQDGNNKVRK